ncbi:hypothetical protein DPMN_056172 [Dreissena polymorpha]|uniref:Uncharacterized protein n=1 Tax=Dreissena polymorpha TaxID=45954 RepID=A0A9D4CTY4_DREPO|nr:hypothetical protein DPMN_056172 [Dreissena polymorpha]
MAALANYNCRIRYRSGKLNADADGLSRKFMFQEGEEQVLCFPDILKVIQDKSDEEPIAPIVCTLVLQEPDRPDSTSLLNDAETIPEPFLQSTALSQQDWIVAQQQDTDIVATIDYFLVKAPLVNPKQQMRRYFSLKSKLTLQDGLLFHRGVVNGDVCQQLVVPVNL